MGKGYAEGSAVEERLAALERGDDGRRLESGRAAVYASTEDEPERHFVGWADEVDPDELFASGRGWGIQVVHRSE
jgi:cystathionine beta-lyase/cystathionine gamma-synthase